MRFLVLLLGLAMVCVSSGVWLTVGDPSGTPVGEIGLIGCVLIGLAIAAIRKSDVKGYAITGVIALVIGGVHFFAGKAINLRNLEDRYWKSTLESDQSADRWQSYLYGMCGRFPELSEKRFADDLGERLRVAREAAPFASPTISAIQEVERRFECSWAEDASFFLATFTPVRAHYAEALSKYGEKRFLETVVSRDAGKLRAYRIEFPDSHRDETAAALRALYADALKKYDDAIAQKETDPEAVAGMRALFTSGDVDLSGVPLEFKPVAGIESGELEEVLQKTIHVKEVLAVGPSFTAERSAERRESLLRSLNDAFQPIAGDLFALTLADNPKSPDRFVVTQRVFPSGSVYGSRAEDKLPVSERTVAIGIAMKFECTVVVSGKSDHTFSVIAKPAAEIATSKIEADPVYNSMATSAYETFTKSLLRGYGF